MSAILHFVKKRCPEHKKLLPEDFQRWLDVVAGHGCQNLLPDALMPSDVECW
jgi:hypothetical protein